VFSKYNKIKDLQSLIRQRFSSFLILKPPNGGIGGKGGNHAEKKERESAGNQAGREVCRCLSQWPENQVRNSPEINFTSKR